MRRFHTISSYVQCYGEITFVCLSLLHVNQLSFVLFREVWMNSSDLLGRFEVLPFIARQCQIQIVICQRVQLHW